MARIFYYDNALVCVIGRIKQAEAAKEVPDARDMHRLIVLNKWLNQDAETIADGMTWQDANFITR